MSGLRGLVLTVRFLCELDMLGVATSLMNAWQEGRGEAVP